MANSASANGENREKARKGEKGAFETKLEKRNFEGRREPLGISFPKIGWGGRGGGVHYNELGKRMGAMGGEGIFWSKEISGTSKKMFSRETM